MVSIIFCQYLW
uniref:Uncharacterized protein n=1 Tax=Rhizophora mucronata TaxID=61149 RepID=A0A2P2P7F0_RHIMU